MGLQTLSRSMSELTPVVFIIILKYTKSHFFHISRGAMIEKKFEDV